MKRIAVTEKTEVQKAREARVKDMIKEFSDISKDAVMHLDPNAPTEIETLPTGIIGIDSVLGGGFPLGCITELFGTEGSGKTTLCTHAMISAQSRGNVATFIDVEHGYNLVYANSIGLDLSALLMVAPRSGEEAFKFAIKAAEKGTPGDIIVMDSIAALVPAAELEGGMDKQQFALQPRLIGKGVKNLLDVVSKNKVVVVLINQLRDKVGIVYGNPESTPGGRALKFLASLRVRVGSPTKLRDSKKQAYGQMVKIKALKSRIHCPEIDVSTPLIYGIGFSVIDSIIDTSISSKIIERTGAFYSFADVNGEEQKFQGKEALIKYLKDTEGMLDMIEARLREKLFGEVA